MKTVLTLVVGLLLGFSWPARAETYEQALAEFDAGDFEGAVVTGRALGTGEGYTIAVRSLLVLAQYVYEPARRPAAIEQAIADGRKALAMSPDHLEARIDLGIAIGLKARRERSISLGREAKRLFEASVEMAPDNAWALAALGGWHAETVYQAGLIPARLIMGARRKRAYEFLERAVAADPDNLTIRAAYVRTLLKLKPEKYAAVIHENISYILEAMPANALERMMQEQMRRVEAAMKENDEDTLKLLLEESAVIIDPRKEHGRP